MTDEQAFKIGAKIQDAYHYARSAAKRDSAFGRNTLRCRLDHYDSSVKALNWIRCSVEVFGLSIIEDDIYYVCDSADIWDETQLVNEAVMLCSAVEFLANALGIDPSTGRRKE